MKTSLKIRSIVKNYTERTKQLDSILNELTRNYCANNCPHDHKCCQNENYSFRVPEEILKLQEKEARKNG